MDTPDSDRFDIYFAGECLDGFDATAVRAAVGELFRADDATLARLFSGKRQRIKAGVDKATARRYQLAMSRAGARAIVARAATPATSADAETRGEDPSDAAGQPRLSLAPPGSDVISAHERPRVDATPPPMEHLSVAASGEDLAPARSTSPAAVAAPDLDVASPGSDLASPREVNTPPPPDLSALSLADPDHDFSDCARRFGDAPTPRTDHLSLAEPDGELISDAERSRPDPLSPRTDHLRLEDDEAS